MTDAEMKQAVKFAAMAVETDLHQCDQTSTQMLSRALLAAHADLARCRAVCEAAERLHEAWSSQSLSDVTHERDEAIIECETNLSATIDQMRRDKEVAL